MPLFYCRELFIHGSSVFVRKLCKLTVVFFSCCNPNVPQDRNDVEHELNCCSPMQGRVLLHPDSKACFFGAKVKVSNFLILAWKLYIFNYTAQLSSSLSKK